ncbi:hypothetical protein ZTR_10774 [Talaromyces verruculosus]|nr:hypothetical protein ZTR_10774 [Talaromyces verruculosus]
MAHLSGWDGVGATPSEIAQKRADELSNEIRRPGRKIEVISDEQWDKWVEEARQRRLHWEQVQRDEYARKYLEEKRKELQQKQAEEYYDQLTRGVERDNKHRQWYEAFFNQFHSPAVANEFPASTWKTLYRSVSELLGALDAAYNLTQTGPTHVSLYHRLSTAHKHITTGEANYFLGIVTKKDSKTGCQVS